MHGEVVEYLKADGAKAIGFDIIFSERRQEIDSKLINELHTFAQNADIPEVRSELLIRLDSLKTGTDDTRFAAAVEKAGNVFQSSVFYADENDFFNKPGNAANEDAVSQTKSILSKSALHLPPFNHSKPYFNATVPFYELALASRGIGHIGIHPDTDGVNRRVFPFLYFKDREKAYPSLSLIIAAYIKDISLDSITIKNRKMFIGDSVIPLLHDDSVRIFYQGGKVTTDGTGKETYQSFYQYIPYEYILASIDLLKSGQPPPLPKGKFKDKIVLISASAVGLTDLKSTPFSPVTPGIEIHANIIDNILSNKFLHTLNLSYEKAYILALTATVAIISYVTGPYWGFLFFAIFAGLVTGIHWWVFSKGVIIAVVSSVIAMTVTYLGVILLKYIMEYREKSFVKAAFGHYIAPAVLENILKSPDKLKLGGEKRYMTVLFSDVEGFTTLSEQIPPDEVSSILNEYLSQMVQCIMQTKGALDKFIGDAVMALWNAPAAQENHAALACETALLMLKELNHLREKWRQEKRPLLNARIGINSGEMVVGNMGSKEIFDYTVLGSEVNTAARLEPLNKDFGTHIIVSEATRVHAEKSCPEKFVFRRLARVVLKGRKSYLEVNELICFRNDKDGTTSEFIEQFEKGLKLFIDSKFIDAKISFQKALETKPDDEPSRIYISLCDYHKENPPPEGWKGIYFQKSK
ncbi:MAG: CHASE2 domain-containing protein [Deltaproteobacteria bacterium]|nr:CHASE2 domain-containing protein [Deltaproteobacteria bacterium]